MIKSVGPLLLLQVEGQSVFIARCCHSPHSSDATHCSRLVAVQLNAHQCCAVQALMTADMKDVVTISAAGCLRIWDMEVRTCHLVVLSESCCCALFASPVLA